MKKHFRRNMYLLILLNSFSIYFLSSRIFSCCQENANSFLKVWCESTVKEINLFESIRKGACRSNNTLSLFLVNNWYAPHLKIKTLQYAFL